MTQTHGQKPANQPADGEEIDDADRDALHILPIAMLPVAHPVLRRARMVKNSRLDSALEFFNAPGCGSGQMDVDVAGKILGLVQVPRDPDIDLLDRVGRLPSFDVYSLRILLRANGIVVANESGLQLSQTRILALNEYMSRFTRPLVAEVCGEERVNAQFTDILQLFYGQDVDTVRARLAKMATKLGIPVQAIPRFLEDYADIFMSLSYYRACLDQILPQIECFMESLADIRENYQLRREKNLMTTLDQIEEVINGRLSSITGRLESFERSTSDMWQDLTAERFRRIESLILGYQTTIGGVLCALSVKMRAWSRLFPTAHAGGPVRRAAFIMSDMRQGIDRIAVIEDNTPTLRALDG